MSKDYKKLYEESIEKARDLHDNHALGKPFIYETCENIFPELRESEDERIRKEIISYIKSSGAVTNPNWIAWLEKQGEQKPAEWDILSAKKGDMLSDGNIVLIVDSIEEFEGRPIINSWYFADSKKFYGKGTSECDRWEVDGFRTATEAECNYLLKMMSNAGYVWNTNKLELMEIEQKSSWNEEDERMYQSIIDDTVQKYLLDGNQFAWLESIKDRVQPQPKQEWSEEDEKKIMWLVRLISTAGFRELENDKMPCSRIELLDWLESLKPYWKPSEEQMEALAVAVQDAQGLLDYKNLFSLYSDLLKL